MDFSTWRAGWLKAHDKNAMAATLADLFEARTAAEGEFDVFTDGSFATFKRLPHLFIDGRNALRLLDEADKALSSLEPAADRTRISKIIRLVRTLVFTANITSPTDLWLTHHVLETYHRLGLMKELPGAADNAQGFAERHYLNERMVELDLHFLHSRAALRPELLSEMEATLVIEAATPPQNWTPLVQDILESRHLEPVEAKLFMSWMDQYERIAARAPRARREGWFPTAAEIAAGLRIVPIVLALRTSSRFGEVLTWNRLFVPDLNAEHFEALKGFLTRVGYVNSTGGLTDLGDRVLKRGPGPFGIIHAYTPYLEVRQDELTGKSVNRWIDRAANIAASQDANAKTFAKGLSALWSYQEKSGFRYNVFIEHALGQGEATRQHFAKLGENAYQYFGADLEDKAIERARGFQERGHLPKNMRFIDKADIGKPELVIDAVRGAGFKTEDAVMVVGNGFHEVRRQTDEGMVEVMAKYRRAGILVIFTEETALEDEELLESAWNTYHAGFRYFHELSGQGLRRFKRPAARGSRILSWTQLATKAGYNVLPEYTSRGRSIYPTPLADANPPISATYFCVPDPNAKD